MKLSPKMSTTVNAAFVATGSNFKRDPGDQSSCLTHGTNEGKGRFRILRRGNGCWFLRAYSGAVFFISTAAL